MVIYDDFSSDGSDDGGYEEPAGPVRRSRRQSTQMRANYNYDSDSDSDQTSILVEEEHDDNSGSEYEEEQISEDEDDDELINELAFGFDQTELNDSPYVNKESWPDPPIPLSESEKVKELSMIDSFADAALQKLLFDAGFRYTLLRHQFEAVRKVAGVPENFPLHDGNRIPSIVEHRWNQWMEQLEQQWNQWMEQLEQQFKAARIRALETGVCDANHIPSPTRDLQSWKQWRMHHSDDNLFDFSGITMNNAVWGLDLPRNLPRDKGLSLSDAMGLGKTVEASAGAILKNNIAMTRNQLPAPTLIVSPNDAVQDQWRDELIANGVAFDDIVIFKKGMHGRCFLRQFKFVLLTRHTAQADIRDLCVYDHRSGSSLFPSSPPNVVKSMYEVYKAIPSRSKWTHSGEKPEDTMTRLAMHDGKQNNAFDFGLLLIDEAHFLKNRVTYASIACVLAGTNAERVVPLTGTPYNNGPSDLATIMTFIDPQIPMAQTSWWDDKKEQNVLTQVAEDWSTRYVLRRDKEVISDLLPLKHVSSNYRVPTTLAQQDIVYTAAETALVEALSRVARLENNPRCDPRQLELMRRVYMAKACITRMANGHPLLIGSGREVTRLFSPSRCGSISEKECPQRCVCCEPNMRPSIPMEKNSKTESFSADSLATVGADGLLDVDQMETKEDYDDDVDDLTDHLYGAKEQEDVLPLSKQLCDANKYGMTHYAHTQCIEKLHEEGRRCPRCQDLHRRRTVAFTAPTDPTGGTKKFWCRHVVPSMPEGFASSPKIDEAVRFILQKKTDKVIVVSFFKAFLDLLEAILRHHSELFGGHSYIARFDGDTKNKSAELKRFKEKKNCRFLLMTVQSGGVGLNLTEATRLLMLDRWYNPFVHEQVEDRIYRIGQLNNVEIRYFDTAGTIDEVMRQINISKKENSRTLIDKIDGNNDRPYQELGGMMGRLLRTVRDKREEFEKEIENDQTGKLHRETSSVPRVKANELRKQKSAIGQSPYKQSAKKKTPSKQSAKKSHHNQTQMSSSYDNRSPVRHLDRHY